MLLTRIFLMGGGWSLAVVGKEKEKDVDMKFYGATDPWISRCFY
jgi:hypothetical protein